jgi:hypothetical protein
MSYMEENTFTLGRTMSEAPCPEPCEDSPLPSEEEMAAQVDSLVSAGEKPEGSVEDS